MPSQKMFKSKYCGCTHKQTSESVQLETACEVTDKKIRNPFQQDFVSCPVNGSSEGILSDLEKIKSQSIDENSFDDTTKIVLGDASEAVS